jgi:hypothetical protein
MHLRWGDIQLTARDDLDAALRLAPSGHRSPCNWPHGVDPSIGNFAPHHRQVCYQTRPAAAEVRQAHGPDTHVAGQSILVVTTRERGIVSSDLL